MEPTKAPAPATKPASSLTSRIFAILAAAIAFIGGRAIGIGILGVLLVLGIPYGLGFWYGKWYGKRPAVKAGWVQTILWSNLILGLILPPLGALAAGAAYGLAGTQPSVARRAGILAGIGSLISLANALFGAYQQLHR